VVELERDQLGAAQPAAEQHRQQGLVALAAQGLRVGDVQQLLGLLVGEPGADPAADMACAAHVADVVQVGAVDDALAVGDRGQVADGGQVLVDGSRAALDGRDLPLWASSASIPRWPAPCWSPPVITPSAYVACALTEVAFRLRALTPVTGLFTLVRSSLDRRGMGCCCQVDEVPA